MSIISPVLNIHDQDEQSAPSLLQSRRRGSTYQNNTRQSITMRHSNSILESHPERFVNYLQGYSNAMLAISLFGGQITFTVILSDVYDPAELTSRYRSNFSKETVRLLVSLSWMLFTFAMGFSAIITILLSDSAIKEVANRGIPAILRGIRMLLLLLNLMPICAVLFLALAVTAYVPVVSWFVTGFVGLFLIVAILLWWIMDV